MQQQQQWAVAEVVVAEVVELLQQQQWALAEEVEVEVEVVELQQHPQWGAVAVAVVVGGEGEATTLWGVGPLWWWQMSATSWEVAVVVRAELRLQQGQSIAWLMPWPHALAAALVAVAAVRAPRLARWGVIDPLRLMRQHRWRVGKPRNRSQRRFQRHLTVAPIGGLCNHMSVYG